MTQTTETLSKERHRVLAHLNLLEKDASHPIDLALDGGRGGNGSAVLILRPGQSLRSAHSDVRLDYTLLRQALMAALQARLAELDEKLEGTPAANLSLEDLQYGDQTEA